MSSHPTPLRPQTRLRARAAQSNQQGRFEPYQRESVDDGWQDAPVSDVPLLRTELRHEKPRKIITRNASPDISFDRSINPYRGCEHGCIYCFARPTHAYLGLSAGLDFETRLVAKPDAPDLLARELSAPRYKPATIAIGTNTDPYQPVERDAAIMRRILEVLLAFRHPVAIVTKGALITRDIDILAELAQHNLVRVGISVTTLDATLSRRMEPRAAAPKQRLAVMRQLADAGIQVRAMVAPVIPALTDHELEAIVAASAGAGAIAASWIMLRLPFEVSELFVDWLRQHYPDRARCVMGHIREMHGGKAYDAQWGRRMRGTGHYAALIRARFDRALRQHRMDTPLAPLHTHLFRVPPRPGDQLSLF